MITFKIFLIVKICERLKASRERYRPNKLFSNYFSNHSNNEKLLNIVNQIIQILVHKFLILQYAKLVSIIYLTFLLFSKYSLFFVSPKFFLYSSGSVSFSRCRHLQGRNRRAQVESFRILVWTTRGVRARISRRRDSLRSPFLLRALSLL